MTIQFQCPACSQPIEIDPEWGGQAVVCPYCRKTVTAPPESTYSPGPQIPMARAPVGRTGFELISEVPAIPQYGPPPTRNLVAMWAMILSWASLVCMAIAKVIFRPHYPEIASLAEKGKTPMEIQQAIMQQYGGVFPDWLLQVSALIFLALLLWIAGLVCAMIGVRHPTRRRWAVMSLITLGFIPILACCIT
jgi:hypothetical protein